MELTRHELYKIFSRKSLYVVTALFYVFYATIMFNQWKLADGDYKEINRVVKEWAGPIDQRDIRWAQAGEDNLRDPNQTGKLYTRTPPLTRSDRSLTTQDSNALASLFHSVLDVEEKQAAHEKRMESLRRDIEERQEDGQSGYAVRNMQKELALLQQQKPYEIYYHIGWRDAVEFTTGFGIIVVGSLVLFGLAPVFTQEHTSRTAGFILSSKLGRRKLVTAKLAASFVYVTAAILSYSFVNLVYHLLAYGGYGASDPVFSLFHGVSPYSFPLWQFFGMTVLILLFGALVFGCLILFVSALSRSPLVPLFAGIAVIAIPLFLANFHVDFGWAKEGIALSYTMLINVEGLFRDFKTYNLFGYPVLYPVVILTFHAAFAGVLVYLTYRRMRTQQLS